MNDPWCVSTSHCPAQIVALALLECLPICTSCCRSAAGDSWSHTVKPTTASIIMRSFSDVMMFCDTGVKGKKGEEGELWGIVNLMTYTADRSACMSAMAAFAFIFCLLTCVGDVHIAEI